MRLILPLLISAFVFGNGAFSGSRADELAQTPAAAPDKPAAQPAPAGESKAGPPATPAPASFAPQDDEKARKFRGELHAKKGAQMMKMHNFRQAESEYKEASRYEPENIQYLEGYANATHKANDCKEAIEAYGRLLKADAAHHTEAHAIIAESLFKLRRYDESADEYKKAVSFEKDKAAIWNKIAEIRLGQAKHPEAMEAYRNAIKADPDDGKAYRLLAAIQWNNGKKAEALATYRDGAKKAPRDGDLQAAFAYALMSEQQWQEAADAYKAAALAKGSTPALNAGYKSAMDHIAYEKQREAQNAARAEKNKKKHKK
jgi:tetratricopeptide (TPR) repeat protein